MEFGLSKSTVEAIQSVFEHYPQIDKVVLYGSRAKGNYKEGSDIDLSLIGRGIDRRVLNRIELDLDELMLPYTIDLCAYEGLQNAQFKEHIQRVGKLFFTRSGSFVQKAV